MAVPAESVPQAPVPSETVPTATVPPAPVPGSGPAAAAPASADAPPESAAAPEPEPAAAPASEPPVAPSVEPAVAPAQTAGDAAPADAPIADGKPFIQAGIFGGTRNIERLIEVLEAAGLPASQRPLVQGATTLTRVLVGPFGTIAERDRALATVRRIGPADAYPVKG